MKHTATQLSLSIAIIGLMLGSCKKKETTVPEEDPPVTTTTSGSTTGTNPISTLQTMFGNLATPVQTYTVNAGSYSSFLCTNGTKIFTSPNAFLTQSGALVTGVVTIRVKDVLSKKDMILNNAFPVSNGQLLVSGGEVCFSPTQNGQSLKINPAGSVTYLVPAGNTPSLQMVEFMLRPTQRQVPASTGNRL